MSPALMFVVSALATYFAWWVLAKSAVLSRPREKMYNRWPPDPVRASLLGTWEPQLGEVVMSSRTPPVGHREKPRPKVSQFSKMLACPYCAGFWIAGLLTLGCDIVGHVPMPALWWPALTTAVGAIASVLDR